jgi:hypothetical protein
MPIDAADGLRSISCATDDNCVAIDGTGHLTTYGEAETTPTPTTTPEATETATPEPTPSATATPLPTVAAMATASPTPTPSRLAPTTPVLRSAKGGKGAVAAVVACTGSPGGRCNVKLTLTAGKRTVGTATVSLSGGTRRTVTVRLNAAGRKLLRKQRLKVQLRVTTGQRTVATKQLTLR